jgi:hypothetical protein
MKESNILKRIMLELAGKATVFRNNTGQAWVGNATVVRQPRTVHVSPGDVVIREARPLHAGLVKGSSDLIGWTKVRMLPRHVGRDFALFTAIEGKGASGRVTPEQENFINQVARAGGLAGIARSPEDAVQIVSTVRGRHEDEAAENVEPLVL